VAEPAFRTEALCRRFGGLSAVNDVSVMVETGAVHAVIGPNGAGKSTLINMLSGDLAPSDGKVFLFGVEVTGRPPHVISQMGVGRSYQRTNVFLPFTAYENCRLAAQSRLPSSMRFVRAASRYESVNAAARSALAAAGLAGRAQTMAAALSHGEQRQLEIAMTLATQPRVLLLDEPLAGMGAEESAEMVALIRRLAAGDRAAGVPAHAVLLVEHDMDAVFALATRLTVMSNGQVLASGTPEAIRANAEVQHAYLGESDAHV